MEPDRSRLDVAARVRVTSPCYVGAGTAAESPPGVRTRGNLVPLLLRVAVAPGASCTPGDAVLSFRHERLAFAEKTGVMVYVVLDGRIVGEMQSLF
jgi:hypothetical protein